ncbi:Glucose-dependent insulinotropic receptor [Liparis tanakae]|uniref:Glucose-dependent insulinotropic receptor n=1 Tax=Liparis tanakae TaxID=230148 RepID=A0A4Z2ERB2_9TELE|nr:Glucose-dependent insulinotropic receptor [Liparis tanakae]
MEASPLHSGRAVSRLADRSTCFRPLSADRSALRADMLQPLRSSRSSERSRPQSAAPCSCRPGFRDRSSSARGLRAKASAGSVQVPQGRHRGQGDAARSVQRVRGTDGEAVLLELQVLEAREPLKDAVVQAGEVVPAQVEALQRPQSGAPQPEALQRVGAQVEAPRRRQEADAPHGEGGQAVGAQVQELQGAQAGEEGLRDALESVVTHVQVPQVRQTHLSLRTPRDLDALESVPGHVQVLQPVVAGQKREVGHPVLAQVQGQQVEVVLRRVALERLQAVPAQVEPLQAEQVEVRDAGDGVLGQVQVRQALQGLQSAVLDLQDHVVAEADSPERRRSAEGALGDGGDAVAVQRQVLQGRGLGQQEVRHAAVQPVGRQVQRAHGGEPPHGDAGEREHVQLVGGQVQDRQRRQVPEEARLDEVDPVGAQVQVLQAGVEPQSLLGEVLHPVPREVQSPDATGEVGRGAAEAPVPAGHVHLDLRTEHSLVTRGRRQTSRPADQQTCRLADQQTSRPADQQTSRPADQQTCRLADQQTSRPADQQTCRLADQQTSRPADLQTSRPADQQTCRPADLQTCRPADQQTCRPADLQTCRPADLQTCRPGGHGGPARVD